MKKKWILTIIAICLTFLMIGVLSACTGEQGPQGPQGEKGEQGIQGVPGMMPTIYISYDGYWVINGDKTEYKAIG